MSYVAILGAVAQSGALSSLTENKEDPARFAKAQTLYSSALAGNKDDECALRHFSGRYGCATCGVNGQVCGFATQAAKDYAGKLYDQYLAVKSGITQLGTPMPTPPVQTGIPITVQTVSGPGGSGVTLQAGNAPATQSERNMWIAIAVIAAIGLAVVMMRRAG